MYPECRHVHSTGAGCNAAALKNSHWCYFHHRFHERYRAQQARLRLHGQRDAAGRFTPAPSSSTALVPTSDYGTYPVADDQRDSAASDVRVHTFAQTASLSLPPIEDSASVQLALVEVLEPLRPSSTPVSLLYPQSRQLSPRVRVFMDWLTREFATRS